MRDKNRIQKRELTGENASRIFLFIIASCLVDNQSWLSAGLYYTMFNINTEKNFQLNTLLNFVQNATWFHRYLSFKVLVRLLALGHQKNISPKKNFMEFIWSILRFAKNLVLNWRTILKMLSNCNDVFEALSELFNQCYSVKCKIWYDKILN